MYFGKRTEDEWWLGVGLGECDRYTVAAKGVNISWLRPSFCQGRVIGKGRKGDRKGDKEG